MSNFKCEKCGSNVGDLKGCRHYPADNELSQGDEVYVRLPAGWGLGTVQEIVYNYGFDRETKYKVLGKISGDDFETIVGPRTCIPRKELEDVKHSARRCVGKWLNEETEAIPREGIAELCKWFDAIEGT
jgi:hypothetical protein